MIVEPLRTIQEVEGTDQEVALVTLRLLLVDVAPLPPLSWLSLLKAQAAAAVPGEADEAAAAVARGVVAAFIPCLLRCSLSITCRYSKVTSSNASQRR